MRRHFGWLLGCGILISGSVSAAAPVVPEPLQPWRDWVLAEVPWHRCTPQLAAHADGAGSERICAWPGELAIEADAGGARFSQRWMLQSAGLVPLPGDAKLRPVEVTLDGQPAEVLLIGDRPMLQLEPGDYAVSGRWRWQRRPEALPIPDESGLVSLRLEGRAIDAIERRDGRLWLGRSESRTVGDSLSLRVYRLLEDGLPPTLHTEVWLEVGGRAREVELGRALPEGFLPLALSSPLPAALGNDGVLRVQLRPGSWRLHLQARAREVGSTFGPPAPTAPWPDEEIWSVRSAAELRVVQPEGERPVDPDQVGAPWGEALPSFALAGGETLKLTEVSRGLAEQRPHRLNLQRDLWLDFSGDGFTARDRLHGELSQVGRLDLDAPWQMLRAAASGSDLLVTAGGDGRSGVELRQLGVDLDVTARQDAAAIERASGWNQDFESVGLSLHLPPGWRLLAAPGADHAAGAWIEGWNLLDWFWLSVIGLLAFRLAGLRLALPTVLLLLLAYHEGEFPLPLLTLAVICALLTTVLPVAGRLARIGGWLQRLSLVLVMLASLPFLHQQLRLTLHPQLEHWEVGSSSAYNSYAGGYADAEEAVEVTFQEAPPPPPPAPMAPAPVLDAVQVTGSRVAKQAEPQQMQNNAPQQRLNQYPKDAVVQAGLGLPDWSWNRHSLSWSGPVTRDQSLGLWLSSPATTALWRIAQCLLLLWVLAALARRIWPRVGLSWARAAPALLLLAALGSSPNASASDLPDAELLGALRERLLQAPGCAPQCAALARAELQVENGVLRLQLDWHAAAAVAVPLPTSSTRWQPQQVELDGRIAEVRQQGGQRWLRLAPGQHRLQLRGSLAGLESLDLRFAPRPAELVVTAAGWDVAGLDDGRLLGDSLQLVRIADAAAGEGADAAPAASEFPPFVRVTRRVLLDLDWSIETRIERIAPQQAGFTLRIPLIEGEQLQDEEIEVKDGAALISFAAGQGERRWRSTLAISPALALSAGPLERHSERWEIEVGPYWSAALSGLPELNSGAGDGVRRFAPLPGETLKLEVVRPEALRGATVAIDAAVAEWTLGQRSRDLELSFSARATRGGQHVLRLPAEAELVSVQLRGAEQNLRLQEGALALPLLPGDNPVQLHLRLAEEAGWHERSAEVDLGASAANLRTALRPGDDRWVLAVRSDGVGPAVLYWPQLLAMAALAWLLARLRWTPLGWAQWTLLGLGFSTVSWWAALVVAGWLLALGWRGRYTPPPSQRWRHGLLQLSLIGLSAIALLCLLAAIPYGLLGSPDMQIAGNGSSAQRLVAFLDRSSGVLPSIEVFSAPLWVYKLAILLWSLWLANALLGWLRWGAGCLGHGGWWPRRRAAASDEAAPVAAEGAAAAESAS